MRYSLLLLLFVAGCGTTAPSAAPVAVEDSSGYAAAMRADYPKMNWPSDVTPDLEALITRTTPPQDEQFQQGLSRQVLAIVNTCAWYRSWDMAVQRGDKDASVASLQVIKDVVTKYPPEADVAGRKYVRDAANQAAEGKGDLARDYVEANCFDTTWRP